MGRREPGWETLAEQGRIGPSLRHGWWPSARGRVRVSLETLLETVSERNEGTTSSSSLGSPEVDVGDAASFDPSQMEQSRTQRPGTPNERTPLIPKSKPLRIVPPEGVGEVVLESRPGSLLSSNSGSIRLGTSAGGSARSSVRPRVNLPRPGVPAPFDVAPRVAAENEGASTSSGSSESRESSLGTSEGSRLRRRGIATNEAWRALVGELPEDLCLGVGAMVDRTSCNSIGRWFNGVFRGQLKVEALYRVRVGEPGDTVLWRQRAWDANPTDDPRPRLDHDWVAMVSVRGGTEVLRVSVRILARLVNYVYGLPRDTATLRSLRARAAQYSKELNMSPESLSWVIGGSCTAAFLVNRTEWLGLSAMGGAVGEDTIRWSERVATGVVRDGGFRYRMYQLVTMAGLSAAVASMAWTFLPAAAWVLLSKGWALMVGAGRLVPLLTLGGLVVGFVAYVAMPKRQLRLARA